MSDTEAGPIAAPENECGTGCPVELRPFGKPDPLNSEFIYYSAVLKILAGTLTNELDKYKILPWAKKLFRPEYHSSQFREKRNKFLLYLMLCIVNDEVAPIFNNPPPPGALPDLETIQHEAIVAAEWELDTTWNDTIENLDKNFKRYTCPVHLSRDECMDDHQLDAILDQEFHFLLYILRPYGALLPNAIDRTRVATWIQVLCSIHGPDACSSMRGIRNDYIMMLLGYVQNLRLVGPFAEYPPLESLPPLAEMAKLCAETKPITDPAGYEANDFLSIQPIPNEGAFCYIAITGELIASSLIQPVGPSAPPDD